MTSSNDSNGNERSGNMRAPPRTPSVKEANDDDDDAAAKKRLENDNRALKLALKNMQCEKQELHREAHNVKRIVGELHKKNKQLEYIVRELQQERDELTLQLKEEVDRVNPNEVAELINQIHEKMKRKMKEAASERLTMALNAEEIIMERDEWERRAMELSEELTFVRNKYDSMLREVNNTTKGDEEGEPGRQCRRSQVSYRAASEQSSFRSTLERSKSMPRSSPHNTGQVVMEKIRRKSGLFSRRSSRSSYTLDKETCGAPPPATNESSEISPRVLYPFSDDKQYNNNDTQHDDDVLRPQYSSSFRSRRRLSRKVSPPRGGGGGEEAESPLGGGKEKATDVVLGGGKDIVSRRCSMPINPKSIISRMHFHVTRSERRASAA